MDKRPIRNDAVVCNCRCPRVRVLTCILPAGHNGDHQSREYLGNGGYGAWYNPSSRLGVQTWPNGQDRRK